MSRTIKKFVLVNEDVRARVADFLSSCALGVEILFQNAKRSLEQNNLMWQLLGEIASQIEWCGLKLSDEDYKDLISASLHGQRTIPNTERNGFVVLGARTSDMNKAELSDLIELIYMFGAENNVKFSEGKC